MPYYKNGFDPIHPLEYGQVMAECICRAEFHEITAKSIDSRQHAADIQKYLEIFLHKHFI